MRQFDTRLVRAAFKTGDRLQYTGDRKAWAMIEGKEVPIIYNGMEVTVIETKDPDEGYGFIRNDEDGEPLIDRGDDGYNVYENIQGQKRIIWPADKRHWKRT